MVTFGMQCTLASMCSHSYFMMSELGICIVCCALTVVCMQCYQTAVYAGCGQSRLPDQRRM